MGWPETHLVSAAAYQSDRRGYRRLPGRGDCSQHQPAGEKARHETLLVLVPGDTGSWRGSRSRPLGQSHNLTRPSCDPDGETASQSTRAARVLPFGAKARQEMCCSFALSVIGLEGLVSA